MAAKSPRYPITPIVAALHISLGQVGGHQPGDHDGVALLAEQLGLTQRAINRYRVSGIPEPQADLLACRIGKHPVELWGAQWWHNCPDPTDDLPAPERQGQLALPGL